MFKAIKETGVVAGVKLQCDDFAENGMDKDQACVIIDKIPFDFVETSGGADVGHKYNVVRPGKDKYYYKHVMEAINEKKLMTKQPVIVTGGFENLEDAAEGLKDGATLVGFSRKFLRNDKFLIEDNVKCLRCN